MTMQAYRRVSDLPDQLAVFPLPGALLFPRWTLSLNIFEPRYLNMIDDTMSGSRILGMVQTTGGSKALPELAHVGCAGRITSYSETDDGRYLIVLTGICRFNVNEVANADTPYRKARPDWSPFEADLATPDIADLPSRERLIKALRDYVARNEMQADWSAVEDAPIETLVNALCAGCPFETVEKQALLESPTLRERADTLIALLEMDVPGGAGGAANLQ
ncbi:MAG: LON peptidase substrate-binding domain-containing protein [Pseudomonadota bacterium]